MKRNNLERSLNRLLKQHKRRKAWFRVLSVLMCITVFLTTYILIFPAITMESTDNVKGLTTAIKPTSTSDFNSTKNSWQIVSGSEFDTDYVSATEYTIVYDSYSGSTPSEDASPIVRMKKSVIPSGNKDSFYICLTMEPIYYHNWGDIIQNDMYIIINNNKSAIDPGKGVEAWDYTDKINDVIYNIAIAIGNSNGKISGNSSYLLPASMVSGSKFTTAQSNSAQLGARPVKKITVYTSGNDNDTSSNGYNPITYDCDLAFALTTSESLSIIIATETSTLKTPAMVDYDSSTQSLTFPYPVFKYLKENGIDLFGNMKQASTIGHSSATGVTDKMGDHIIYKGVKYCNTGNDTVAFNNSTSTLSWNVMGIAPYTTTDSSDWEQCHPYRSSVAAGINLDLDDFFAPKGAYQLIYEIALDTDYTGFVGVPNKNPLSTTGTKLNTNASTVLGIKLEDGTTKSASFTSPVVCSDLVKGYSVKVVLTNQSDVPLEDGEFKITGTPTDLTLPPTGSDGTTMPTGDVIFDRTSNYSLTETLSPPGYNTLDGNIQFSVDEDGTPTVTGVGTPAGAFTYEYDSDNNVLTLKIKATPNGPLPVTGSSGAETFIISGLSLMVFAIITIIIIKTKFKENENENN